MSLEFHRELCTSCSKCVDDCVCGILTMNDNYPVFKEGKSHMCVHCGHCVAICPSRAVSLDGMDPALLQPAPKMQEREQHLDFFLKGRRAIRQYAGTSVARVLLDKALAYASYAPTAHNYRQVAYTVVNGRGKVEQLLASTIKHMEKHGMYIGHVANVKNGNDTIFRGAPCLILLHAPDRVLSETDCATAASYLELAFLACDLGSCWAGMLIESCVHGLPEGLEIPEGNKLYGALMVGKPAVSYERIPFRQPSEVTWK